jgi:PPOX class probable F420-dependent enzyme
MSELTEPARAWLASHHQVVLVTIRADGSPQSSNVMAAFEGETFRVSVTADRAKTRNLERDPRAVAHVLGDNFWSYASVTCIATLGPVTEQPGDEAGRDLLALHDVLSSSPHSDPEEFFTAMVAERRLVLTLEARSIVGSGW